MDKKTPFAVYQARNAVLIAKAAGADTYLPSTFALISSSHSTP